MMRRRTAIVVACLASSSPTTTLGNDGILEISQACATTGCFPGDDPGLPVTISSPGSYRLTSNLIIPDESADGIAVNSSDVALDLNGFSIVRLGCEVGGGQCQLASTGTGWGVRSNLNGVSVSNGSVVGMGELGIGLGSQSTVRNLTLRLNRRDGINVGAQSIVLGNVANRNGEDGISANLASVVSGNVSSFNNSRGIVAGPGALVTDNSAHRNGGRGISVTQGSTVSNNAVYENVGDGIGAEGQGSTVSGNTVHANEGYQLDVASDVAYRGNTLTTSPISAGTVRGGVDAGGNVCDGSLICASAPLE